MARCRAPRVQDGLGLTHKQDHCTFETLCKEFAMRDPKTLALGQIVHDADLGDDKFGRAEGQAIRRSWLAGRNGPSAMTNC